MCRGRRAWAAEGRGRANGNTRVGAQPPDTLSVSVPLPTAGICSLLSPDLGVPVSCLAVVLLAPLSLAHLYACPPVPSLPASSLFVREINLSAKLSSSAGRVSNSVVVLAGINGSHQPLG